MQLAKGSADLETCPVRDEILKKLLDSALNATSEIAGQLPDEQRAAMAIYCYRRSHLRRIGLQLAAQCERADLVREAGTAGELIFMQSRNAGAATEDMKTRSRGTRPPVSLHSV
ncbi:hypothetical protein [Labrenzia sp. PHM005]|uniref:hypothetical protein n=1 Tax=Stappiaceae TaxID=2821832 RepID=UPI001140834A|nr:hypothetical protein [Labrenzia sp. PHM005]QDG79158.1 hypothetical protein FJ695_26645 [Labrenzia sp. PHM005]